ncbi:MAG: Alpha-2-macroglobulin domain protein [Bacteroidetes bacterium]|nr:Alpha-2-macroglobulin domain protein [Bacteroidota bacterium]
MLLQKIKWMTVGVALTAATVFIYNHRDSFRNLSGGNRNGMVNQINPEFAAYISAFTTGYISTGSTIKIKFANEFAGVTELNKPLDKDYFTFSPDIEGEAVWKDGQTMEFKPKERLKPGQTYKATFHLDKLIEVKKELEDFEFNFQAIKQSVQLNANDLKCYNSNDYSFYSLAGTLASADFIKPEQAEQLLSAKLDSKNLQVKWMHNERGTEHKFLIDSIERDATSSKKLYLDCNAKALDLEYTASQTFIVPAQSSFQLLGTKIGNDSEQFVELSFSNPIDESQSLEGILDLKRADNTESQDEYDENGSSKDIKYVLNNNHVLIYPNKVKAGSYQLKIREGIRDTKGQTLGSESKHNIVFEEVKPAIRFMSEGNILPSTNGLNMPFETVNLRAVDVKIVKIYENNVLQFLQSNVMDGNSQMAQVGKKIIEKRINLGITNPGEFGTWKKFSLDLSNLIKAEPGAIYKVYLSMKKSYSTYSCLGNSDSDKFEMEDLKEAAEEEVSFYGYYYDDEYGGGYYEESEEGEEYNWNDRNNPCKSMYYRQYERTISKSILASDIGLTFKKGNDGSYFAVANDLVTTKPMSGVTIELYDFQKQLIQSIETNKEGQAFITPGQKPAFVVAKKDKQRAYLRLDDGSTLSLSMYDVNGEAVRKGLKGFIYGERGVWRPGDSLFLNFILEDKTGSIPANHPVVFELTNPQGQLYKRQLSSKSISGFYNFSTATDKNVPTGLWNVEVKVGSIKFSKSVRIEAIMPNRLKIEVNIGDNKMIHGTKPVQVKLHTQWLTGAVAHGLAANVGVSFSQMETEFPKFKDYTFEDQTNRFESQTTTIFDGNVDDNGNTSFPLNVDVQKNAPGFLRANFTTRVFEQGGAFSIDRFSMTYSPFNYYCGVKLPKGESNSGILYTGKDHLIDVATVDANGNAASRSNLRFELYKLEWRWWWDQYNDELANYSNDEYHKAVQTENFSTKNGTAQIKVNIKENQWGRYLIRIVDLDGGHVTTAVTYFDWSNWMERDGSSDNKIIASMLKFTTDKTSYKTNEEVSVTIPSPQNGRALVTIENGSRVLEAHWLETEKGSTIFKFKVTPQMAPNVYVHVSLMQPHSRTNDLPIRLYGVVPISIDDPETHLRPTISMPATLMPEKKVDIVVGEENSKEMAFTIAVVDEGLLDITRFKTPNPWGTFYAKEAIGVKTWDVYDRVIGAFGAELERILSVGGDGSEAGEEDGAKANRFKPMVRFFGPFQLKKGEKKTVSFQMPMYVGSVRTMVIAGNKGAYGMAEKTTPVKAPLMILGTLPRVLSVTEEVKLPVTIFGGDKDIGKTDVKLEVNGLLQTVGGNVKTVSVGRNDEKMVVFDIKVKNMPGIAKAKIIASGGGHTAVYEMELDVRNPNPYQTTVKEFFVDGGKELKETFTATGLPGTNSGALELSTIPPVNLEERLHYLITYPHGCIEQTTSQTFAQLYLSDIMELSAERKTEIEKNIKGGISEIYKFQLPSGGMSYWKGLVNADDWGSSYAGHFMVLAEKKGYTLPSGFKKKWISFQQNLASNFELNKNSNWNNDVLQAYRLYVLSVAGQPVMSAMNRLREYNNLSNQARWLLAAAYAQSGQQDEAEKLVAKASQAISPYSVNYYTYGSSDRDEAMVLEALCLMGKKSQAFNQLKKVSAFLSSKKWLSTQTTAYGLVAVASFVKKYGDASAMQVEVELNGKEVKLKGNTSIVQIPVDFKTSSTGNFNIENNGKGILYVRLISRGKPAIGSEVEGSENISMDVSYKDMNGSPLDVNELTQGKDFIMQVTVKNLGLVGLSIIRIRTLKTTRCSRISIYGVQNPRRSTFS